jgi:hypothetical protein
MGATEKIEEKAMGAIDTLGRIYEKLPDIKEAMKLLENKETELRIKFENMTLDGDIAISITLVKEEKDK